MSNVSRAALVAAGVLALAGCGGGAVCKEGARQGCSTACGNGTEVCLNDTWQNCDAPKPGKETCDGIDNNCDGRVDEGCDCVHGTTEKCYDGPAATRGKGSCKDGVATCTAGKVGVCIGAVLPEASERCDGVDNNCDGQLDEGCACKTGQTQECTSACGKGEAVCVDGVWKNCTAPQPQQELCDGVDNNCDGKIDETCACVHGASEGCFSGPASARGKGKCKDGSHVCSRGVWGNCVGEVLPDATEKCDGIDNNCDGVLDEGCNCTDGQKQACTTACGKGEVTCVGGEWKNCTAPQPQQEVCDGLDNNCDGKVDEVCSCVHGTTEACFEGAAGNRNVGQCKDGLHTCDKGKWGACTGQVLPDASDACNDLADNDCDGTVNDGCTCSPGATQVCGSDVGECKKGLQTCSNNAWGACANEVKPAAETCDGKDNDCNSKVDDGLPQDAADPNDSCPAARVVEVSDAASAPTELTYTLYPSGDVDYVRVNAIDDVINVCVPFRDPKCNYLTVELLQTGTSGIAYEATLFTAGCDDPTNSFKLDKTTPTRSLMWEGTCGFSNSSEFWIKVVPSSSSSPKYSCKPYKLKISHTNAIANCQ